MSDIDAILMDFDDDPIGDDPDDFNPGSLLREPLLNDDEIERSLEIQMPLNDNPPFTNAPEDVMMDDDPQDLIQRQQLELQRQQEQIQQNLQRQQHLFTQQNQLGSFGEHPQSMMPNQNQGPSLFPQEGMNGRSRRRGSNFTRSAPGRSVSMPLPENGSWMGGDNSGELMRMQQNQRQLLLLQQQQSQLDNSQGSHSSFRMATGNSVPLPADVSPSMGPGTFKIPGQGPFGNEQAPSTPTPTNPNELMVKLCESMRRSARSRSLVKQLSGQSGSQQGNLAHSNEDRMRALMGLSGSSLPRASGRSHPGRDTAPSMPMRRMAHDTNHQMSLGANSAGQSRGVHRHQSHSAIIGMQRALSPFQNAPHDFDSLAAEFDEL